MEIEGKGWWIIEGGGGAKGMLAPLSNYWGGGAGPPLPTPFKCISLRQTDRKRKMKSKTLVIYLLADPAAG